jgi:hypothetical protein
MPQDGPGELKKAVLTYNVTLSLASLVSNSHDYFRLFYLQELSRQCTCTPENLALPPYEAEAERRIQMSTTWIHDNCACSRPLRPRPGRVRVMSSAPIQADKTV